MNCSTDIYDRINTIYVSLEDVIQFGIDHLPVSSKMNVRDVVNVQENDNNYISGYCII